MSVELKAILAGFGIFNIPIPVLYLGHAKQKGGDQAMADTQSRKWQLTINNPQQHGLDHEKIKGALQQIKPLVYYCLSDEVGLETHTQHTHIFLALKTPAKFSRIERLFPEAHIEQARGSVEENRAYMEKSGKSKNNGKADSTVPGTFEEWGTMPDEPGQGYRSDIAQLYNLIVEGNTNAEIMRLNPNLAVHISRMDKIRQDVLEARYRDEFRHLDLTYIFGPTGTGKTRGVMELGYSSVYRVTDCTHPFDRYAQEPVILFDEFRSSLMLGDMLSYLDGYPIALPARYANRQACYTSVYIISNIDLSEQYKNVQENEPATWKAFLRRIHHVIEYHHDKPPTNHGNAMDYIYQPSKPVPAWVLEAGADDTYEQLPF